MKFQLTSAKIDIGIGLREVYMRVLKVASKKNKRSREKSLVATLILRLELY